MTILSDIDLIIFPIYFLIVTLCTLFYNYYNVENKYQTSFIYSYFIKALCTIAYAFLFNNYYQSGDTINFYNDAIQLKHYILQDLQNTDLYWKPVINFWTICEGCVISFSESSFLIVKISSILLVPTFGSYLSAALILGFLSHLGTYKIIQTFSSLFPETNFSILFFIPSVLFWSSGIMKDGLCIFALGYLFAILENSFRIKKTNLFSLIGILILCYIILVLKGYILISFLFCYSIRLYLLFKNQFENKILSSIGGFLIGALLIVLVIGISSISDKFVFENLLELSVFTQQSILDLQGGSTYEITYDLTPWGLLSAFLQSFVVAFFRPFLWESSNPLLLLFAIESLAMACILFYAVYRRMSVNKLKRSILHPVIIFSLLFSFIFGTTVGFTSSNFGALMRYKIPYLLFYIAALLVLYDESKKK